VEQHEDSVPVIWNDPCQDLLPLPGGGRSSFVIKEEVETTDEAGRFDDESL
jgi:hypothetical protein